MVALNAHFTLLAACCSLSDIAFGPLSAHAAAVRGPALDDTHSMQSRFRTIKSAAGTGGNNQEKASGFFFFASITALSKG